MAGPRIERQRTGSSRGRHYADGMTGSSGWTAPGFEGVRHAFEGNFERECDVVISCRIGEKADEVGGGFDRDVLL